MKQVIASLSVGQRGNRPQAERLKGVKHRKSLIGRDDVFADTEIYKDTGRWQVSILIPGVSARGMFHMKGMTQLGRSIKCSHGREYACESERNNGKSLDGSRITS